LNISFFQFRRFSKGKLQSKPMSYDELLIGEGILELLNM